MKDRGLKQSNLDSAGVISNINGKIGTCYKLTESNKVTGAINDFNYANTSMSMGGWFKFNKAEISSVLTPAIVTSTSKAPTGNLIGNNNYGGFGLVWEANDIYTSGSFNSISFYPYLRKSSQSLYITTASFRVNFDTWYHFMVTLDIINRKISFYVNGVLYSSASYSSNIEFESHDYYLNVGWIAGGNGPGKPIPLYANDVRMYDHALSAKEVKEISKGLVLHYNFEDEEIEPTTNLISGTAGAGTTYVQKTVEAWATTVTHGNFGNNIYTFSVYIKNNSEHPLAARLSAYNAAGTSYNAVFGNYIQPGAEGRSIVTINTTDTSQFNGLIYLYIQNGNAGTVPTEKTFYIKEAQFEQKDHATSYTPSSRSAGKVYDNSGYGYNGYQQGESIQIVLDSASGKHSARFDSSGSGTSWLNTNGIEPLHSFTNLTYTAWIYQRTRTDDRACICIGQAYFTIDVNGHLSGYAYGKNPAGYHTGSGVIPLNTWTHIAIVWDDSYIYGYINGVQDFKVATTGTISYLGINIGKEGGSWRQLKGSIADLKIYSTALSADDIMLEYRRKAAIARNGRLITGLFIEDGSVELLPGTHVDPTGNVYRQSGDPSRLTQDSDGSMVLTNTVWTMTPKFPVNAGETLYWDITYSNTSGNLFYIGFEQFDANGASGSNELCKYVIGGDANARDHYRVKGTITVSTVAESGNPITHWRLRVLNAWNGASATKIAKVHHISLRRISTLIPAKIDKNDFIITNSIREDGNYTKVSIYKNGFIGTHEIIED